mmetsp:Transcript_30726/g.48159  ORF Transcript_30726/g.48159 Transcript_30726/m.48159 type:complete len:435 (+) Transcript_30726:111-1415(+)
MGGCSRRCSCGAVRIPKLGLVGLIALVALLGLRPAAGHMHMVDHVVVNFMDLSSNMDVNVPALVGCKAEVPLEADNSAAMVEIDTTQTPMLPLNLVVECMGVEQIMDDKKMCVNASGVEMGLKLHFSPTREQIGVTSKVCAKFTQNGVGGATATRCINFMVPEPEVQFSMVPMSTSETFRVGCTGMLAFKAMVNATSHGVPEGTMRSPAEGTPTGHPLGCGYTATVGAVVNGNFPPSATGMPMGVDARDGTGMMAGVPMLAPGMGDDRWGERYFEFKWTPARGHESSVPYRVCFKAMDEQPNGEMSIGGQVKCYSIKVQKCQYCSQAGDSLNSLAAEFDTDWLHLYTTNPTIKNPDTLVPGHRVNTGVLYEVRKGDYLEYLSQKFFTSVDKIYSVNPDLKEEGVLLEGDEICIVPPVCGVVCDHGQDCRPMTAV